MTVEELKRKLDKYPNEYEVGFYRFRAGGAGKLVFQPVTDASNDVEDGKRVGLEFGKAEEV